MSKKLKVIAALCAVTAVSLFSGVVGCGGNEETKHTYSADWSKDATNHWHACIDEGCTEIDGKAAHAFDEGKVTKEATCAEAGEKVYTCSVCKYEKEETIAKTDEHTFYDGKITKEPTYDEDGVKTFTCTVCGYEKTESVPKKEHVYSNDWSKDATNHWHACIDEGCTEIDGKAAHAFDEGKVTKEATCAEAGEKVYTCSVCKYEKEETIAKTDEHTFYDGKITKEPTYDEDGVKTFTCTVCGYEKTESVPKKEHVYSNEWSKDATSHWRACTDEGYETLKKDEAAHTESAIKYSEDKTKEYTECTVCGYKMSEKEHTHTAIEGYESDETSHWQLCACGEKMDETAHAAKDDNYKIDETNHWKECVCGAKVEVAAHTAGSELKHSADKDYHWNECTVCGTEMNKTTHTAKDDKYESDETNHWKLCTCGEKVGVAAHEFGAWVTVTEPTLDADGTKKHTCSVCEKEVTTEMKFEELLVDYVTVQNSDVGADPEGFTDPSYSKYYSFATAYSTTSMVYKFRYKAIDTGTYVALRDTNGGWGGYQFIFSNGIVQYYVNGDQKATEALLTSGTTYEIELGSIDTTTEGKTYIYVKIDGEYKVRAMTNTLSSSGCGFGIWGAGATGTFMQSAEETFPYQGVDYVTVTNSTLGLAESVAGFEGATYTSSYSTTSVVYKAKITGNGNVKIRAAAAWEGGYQFNIIDGGKVQVLEGASHFATTDAIFTTGDTVEYGAIDLKDGKQTYIFIKINGVVKYSTIRNSLEATSIGNMVTAWGGTFEEPAAE